MESSDFYIRQENNERFVKKGPLTKAFSEGRVSEMNLPTEVKTNPELLQECKERKNLVSELDSLYLKIPTLTDIDTALEKDLVTLEEVRDFYKSVVDLIEKDNKSSRLLLYLPLELIPDSKNEELHFFVEFYKNNWKELLKELDIREGFNVGDIPESEIRKGSLAKVSKAAHLIPSLIEKGIVNKSEVFDILENETNETVTESILDTLRILADKKYIDEDDLNHLDKTKKIGVKNMVKMIRYDQNNPQEESENHESANSNIDKILFSMNLEVGKLESNTLDTESIPPARLKWLSGIEKDKIIEKYSEVIYKKLSENEEEIDKLSDNKDLSEESAIVLIRSLEKLLIKNLSEDKAYTALLGFKKSPNVNIKNELLNTLNKLNSVNILNEKYFSKNELVEQELKTEKNIELKIKNVLSKMETDPFLVNSVYPVSILCGSHIKGYGKENSDTDMSVFIKEDVAFDKHDEIKARFDKILKELNINGSIMEFWFKEEEGSIWIKDFENPDNSLGDSAITSPITGIWYGDEKTIQTLQTELLPQYLYSENKKIFGFNAREVWLRDMEHNLIQYRLMHKGYKERNLEQGGIDSIYKNEIDGGSMFYDSGFRRLATKIYLEKVFLPQLKKD